MRNRQSRLERGIKIISTAAAVGLGAVASDNASAGTITDMSVPGKMHLYVDMPETITEGTSVTADIRLNSEGLPSQIVNGVQWAALVSGPLKDGFVSGQLPPGGKDYFLEVNMDPSFNTVGNSISTGGLISGNIRLTNNPFDGMDNYDGIVGTYTFEPTELGEGQVQLGAVSVGDTAGNEYDIFNNLQVTHGAYQVNPVPEPGTFGGLAIAGIGALAAGRRNSRKRREERDTNYDNSA
jgi:hypothetical protein